MKSPVRVLEGRKRRSGIARRLLIQPSPITLPVPPALSPLYELEVVISVQLDIEKTIRARGEEWRGVERRGSEEKAEKEKDTK